jgi:hypothetical protein
MIDERTFRNYQLPHPENIAKHDVVRMREAFVAVDADISAIETIIAQNNAEKKQKELEEFLGLWNNKVE